MFLQPTVIEGKYTSWVDLMLDPKATTQDAFEFGKSAEAGVEMCNADKAGARDALVTGGKQP